MNHVDKINGNVEHELDYSNASEEIKLIHMNNLQYIFEALQRNISSSKEL